MEIQQAVVDVDALQDVLDAETLAADVLHLSLVFLVQRLHDEVYQHRAFATQFFQVDFFASLNNTSCALFGRFTVLPSWIKSFISRIY